MLTDSERDKQFVEMARDTQASEDAEAFDNAFAMYRLTIGCLIERSHLMTGHLRAFDTPHETIEWAGEAIQELNAIYDEFLGPKNMHFVVEPHLKPQYKALKIKARNPPPTGLRRKATEALNNVRHSFDQTLHAACVALGKPRPRTNFTWRPTPREVQGYLRSKDIPVDLWEVIMGEEPYKRGNGYVGGDDFIFAVAKLADGKQTIGFRIMPQVRDSAQPVVSGNFVLIPKPVWVTVNNEQVIAFGPHDMQVKGDYTVILNITFDEPGPLHDQSLAWGLARFHAKAQKFAHRMEARCIELQGS